MLNLNLVPPQLKAEHQSASSRHRWLVALNILAVLIIIGTAGSATAWQLLKRHGRNVHDELLQAQKQQGVGTGTDITTITSQLNATIQTMGTALGAPQAWSELAGLVIHNLPAGATIAEFSLTPNGAWRITGITDSRQTFVSLEQSLKNNPRLSKVTTTSTASKRTAVPFDFSGIVSAPTTKP